MFFSKKVEKYSLENFRQLHAKLLSIKEVTPQNQAQVIEILRMISELMIWGDQHNSLFFEFFVDKSILAMYVNYIRSSSKEIHVQVIQALGILIANTKSREVTYYLLSNNYINQLISFPFDFANTEELTAYYISFLKTLSNKLSLETIDFLFNQTTGEFPLFSEALKLASNPDTMVRIAVRTLSLNVFRLNHPPLRKHLTEHAVHPYFTNLALFLVVQFNEMNCALSSMSPDHRNRLDDLVERHADWLHYMQDVLELKVDAFSEVLLDCLLTRYLLPVLLPLLSADLRDPTLFASVGLALFLISQVFVTFDHAGLVNSLAKHLNDVARLLTHPDERVVYYSMIVMLTLLKCRAVDQSILRQTGLFSNDPHNFRPLIKDFQLTIRTDEEKIFGPIPSVWDTTGIDTPLSTPQSVSEHLTDLALSDSAPEDTALSSCAQSSSGLGSEASSESCTIHTVASPSVPPLSPTPSLSASTSFSSNSNASSNSCPSSSSDLAAVVAKMNLNENLPETECMSLACALSTQELKSLPYPDMVIGSLLQLLTRMDSIQLGTLQLMCELVRELMLDSPARPRLQDEHLQLIRIEVRALAEFIKDQLQQAASSDRMLDLIEDEVTLLQLSSTNLTQHKNLLPIPLTEGQLRRSVQQYMCTRKLLREMSDCLPVSASSGGQRADIADPVHVLLRKSITLTRGTCMEMDKDMKVIPCMCLQDNSNVFLLLHPDLLLLVKKHSDPKLVSQAVVELALPLRNQEAQQSPYNPSVLLLKMKSERLPHPAGQKIPSSSSAERERANWSLSLVFTHQRHCLALVRHLKEARTRSRQETLKCLLPFLNSEH